MNAPNPSVLMFIAAIEKLPSDKPGPIGNTVGTRKQQWIDWLADYHNSGGYGRTGVGERDAKYAYNHIVNPLMLLWLIEAAGLGSLIATRARKIDNSGKTLMENAGGIRKLVTWDDLASALRLN